MTRQRPPTDPWRTLRALGVQQGDSQVTECFKTGANVATVYRTHRETGKKAVEREVMEGAGEWSGTKRQKRQERLPREHPAVDHSMVER